MELSKDDLVQRSTLSSECPSDAEIAQLFLHWVVRQAEAHGAVTAIHINYYLSVTKLYLYVSSDYGTDTRLLH